MSPGATASYVTAKEQVDQDAGSPPSLVSKMAQNWKDVETGAALQQTSANFKRRIVHVSKPFIDWGINAKRAQGLVKSAGLTGTALVHEKENMPANKNDAGSPVPGDDKGRCQHCLIVIIFFLNVHLSHILGRKQKCTLVA